MKVHICKFIVILVSIVLVCSNSFATNDCRSNHDSMTVSGSCECDSGTCGGAVITTYHYICVSTTCSSCVPNGTRPGIVGYQYPCNEVSCGSDPGICANNYSGTGSVISGNVMNCSCS